MCPYRGPALPEKFVAGRRGTGKIIIFETVLPRKRRERFLCEGRSMPQRPLSGVR